MRRWKKEIKDKAVVIDDGEEKTFALKCLMGKYQPEGGYGDLLEEKLRITSIVRIDIEEMTGKEDLGKETMRETVLKVLENKIELPARLEGH